MGEFAPWSHAPLPTSLIPNCWMFAAMQSTDTEEIMTFLNDSIKGKCEGLMVKTLDENASYEPARRSLNWLKVCRRILCRVCVQE